MDTCQVEKVVSDPWVRWASNLEGEGLFDRYKSNQRAYANPRLGVQTSFVDTLDLGTASSHALSDKLCLLGSPFVSTDTR